MGSYRRALAETIWHFDGWRPSDATVDALKGEGRWNNDWEAAYELLRRHSSKPLPAFSELVDIFNGFYFGGDPHGDSEAWQGFIGHEPLLVGQNFFHMLTRHRIAWGFVSGAEPPSARYVLESRLGLRSPPLIAMGDAPEKPDPTGLLRLAEELLGKRPGLGAPPVAYLGDTVADVQTVVQARKCIPQQIFISLAVAPPHLHNSGQEPARKAYEAGLLAAGADHLLASTVSLTPELLLAWLSAP